MMDTPAKYARFLVRMGYDRTDVITTVAAQFPDAEGIEATVDAAIQQFDKSTAELNREIQANDAAIAAEHRED